MRGTRSPSRSKGGGVTIRSPQGSDWNEGHGDGRVKPCHGDFMVILW